MTVPAPVRAKVLRDFNDAGTGENFTADTIAPLSPGAFANYRAAGLVEAAPEEAASDAGEAAPASGRKAK